VTRALLPLSQDLLMKCALQTEILQLSYNTNLQIINSYE